MILYPTYPLDERCSRSRLRLHSFSRAQLNSSVTIPRRIQELGAAFSTAVLVYPTRSCSLSVLVDVDWLWMGRVEPLDVFLFAHCPFAWCVLIPISDLIELYPWKLGVVLLAAGVGLFELHPSVCDSVSNVHFHIVFEVLKLVNAVLRGDDNTGERSKPNAYRL